MSFSAKDGALTLEVSGVTTLNVRRVLLLRNFPGDAYMGLK